MLFVGFDGKNAVIYDGIDASRTVDPTEIRALWDGAGIVVSDAPIDRTKIVMVAFFQAMAWFVGSLLLLCSLAWVPKAVRCRITAGSDRFQIKTIARETLALFIICGIVWGIHYIFTPGGLLGSQAVIASIQDDHYERFLRKVKAEDIKQLIETGDTLIVDARLPADYKEGHLPGAINIPPNSTADDCKHILSGRPTKQKILLYCHSDGCPYS